MTDSKPFWESQTWWSNAIAVILVCLVAIISGDLVSPTVAKWLVVSVTTLNAVLTIYFKTQATQTRIALSSKETR